MRSATCLLIIGHLIALPAFSEVLRVPSVYGTIQFALSNVSDGDTILVAPGIYVESLTTPPRVFTLKSEVRLDSSSTQFAVLDPTDVPGSDTLASLTLTGGRVFIEDMVIRNRSGMTDGRPSSISGGVVGDTAVHEISATRCLFDSVAGGISQCDRITLRGCRFIGSKGSAVFTGLWRGKLFAYDTWFDGANGGLVTSGRGCEIKNCLFTQRGELSMFVGLGDSLYIENCRFVGLDTMRFNAVQLRPRCGSTIRDCVFENIVINGGNALWVTDTCFNQPKDWECVFKIINNRFVNCGSSIGGVQNGGEPIYIQCSEGSSQGFIALLDSNRIDSTGSVRGHASGILLRASAVIRNTTFGDVLPHGKPQVAIYNRSLNDTVYLRFNSFSQDFSGVDYFLAGNTLVDARWNWWGHESGPYHPQNNPQGQGASVDDGIRFNPWLLSDPDTSTHGDTTESVGPEIDFAPEQFSIRAFPNPFNAVTTLEIEVARAGEYEVVLYDVTGRVAANVFRGRIEHSQRLSVDAAGLSSGVYFARLSGSEGALAVGKVLLLK
ncbi:T9SS type A sorting domain-containing protein [bacterium]|nr:T9SS type A sorting domain-containing protein [bacterium]